MNIIPGTIPNPLGDRMADLERVVQQLQAKLDIVYNSHFSVSKPVPFDYNLNWSLQQLSSNHDPVNY